MGCAPSSGAEDRSGRAKQDKLLPPAPIPVDIGAGVIRTPPTTQAVIFIFGGPGSQKGLVIEELTTKFDFVLKNSEDIIFSYLPNKVSNTVETTAEIKDMLAKDPGVLTVDWVLSMVSARLSTSMQQRFLVDIVPSLNCFLKADSFLQDKLDSPLEEFERRHPIMFALELNLCNEEAIMKEAEKAANDKENGKKQLSAELNAFLKGIDEADKGRLEINHRALQRRMDLYHKCSNSFLNYFKKTAKIIRYNEKGCYVSRVDLYGMRIPHAVSTVSKLFGDFGFSASRSVTRVILFSMGENFDEIDLDFYKMRKVTLSHICKERGATLKLQMEAILRYLQRHQEDDNYAIILDTVSKEGLKVSTCFSRKSP